MILQQLIIILDMKHLFLYDKAKNELNHLTLRDRKVIDFNCI